MTSHRAKATIAPPPIARQPSDPIDWATALDAARAAAPFHPTNSSARPASDSPTARKAITVNSTRSSQIGQELCEQAIHGDLTAAYGPSVSSGGHSSLVRAAVRWR